MKLKLSATEATTVVTEMQVPEDEIERVYRESLLAQTLNNVIHIKVEALDTEENLLNRLSRRASLDCFINSYRGLKLMAELLRS